MSMYFKIMTLLLVLCGQVEASDVTSDLAFAWNACKGGGEVGYALLYGNSPSNYTHRLDVLNVLSGATNITATVTGLEAGQTVYFVVKAYDAQGLETPASNQIVYTVPGAIQMVPGKQTKGMSAMRFSVAPGHIYTVQATTDLTSWISVWQTTSATNGWIEYSDPAGANLKMRFYRLKTE